MTTQTHPRNWTYLLVTGIVRLFMTAAAAISFSHIVATSHALGLGGEAYTVPLFIDGLAILGLVGRSARFAASTQRAGMRLMAGAGLLSLACNVYAGHNAGQRLYGALVVTAFVTAEWYAARLRPAPTTPAKPAVSDEQRARRSDAARRGAETKRRNAEATAKAEAKAARERRRAERAQLEKTYALPAAPVSPAPVGV